MYRDLQINRLRALVTVIDLGGFRRAADALHITQPAVSQQIRQLSTLIKGPIFLSTGRDILLSDQGEELLGYARRIVALNDEAVDRFLPPTSDQRLTIGVGDQLAEALPDILRGLSTGMPKAQISVRTGPSETLQGQVTTGQLDLALVLQPSPHRVMTAAWHELGHLRMNWFGEPTSRAKGAELPLTLFTEPCTLRGTIMATLDASSMPWRVGYEGPELIGLRAAAKAGLGVACLIDNGDELWGLPRTTNQDMPEPPGPVPVSMAVSAAASTRSFVRIAERSLRDALREYPFAA